MKGSTTVSFPLYYICLRYSFDTRKIGDFVARLNDTQRIQSVIKQLITATTVDILSVIISVTFYFLFMEISCDMPYTITNYLLYYF